MNHFVRNHYSFHFSPACGFSGGTAILVKKQSAVIVYPEWDKDRNGRICSVELVYRNELYKLISIHAPNDSSLRKEFFSGLRQYLDSPGRTIFAGDFNCVLRASDCSKKRLPDTSLPELRKLLRDYDLQDVTELAPGNNDGFTHWQDDCYSRLDRLYASSDLSVYNVRYKVKPVAFSDHAFVTAIFEEKERTTRRRKEWQLWKLNESLLDDKEICDSIRNLIKKKTNGGHVDAILWEDLKEECKMFLLTKGQEKAALKKSEKLSLMRTLENLIEAENCHPGTFTEDIRECKGQLLSILEKEYKGAMIRSRMESQLRDEEPLKIFKTKERQRGRKNRIEALQSGDSILTSQNDIEAAFTEAYKDLFEDGSNTCDRELLKKYASTLNCINDETKQQTDECISESEIEWAIRKLKPRKSPGVDGLSTDFYKRFSSELVPILREVYDDIAKRGLLPPSMR
ncbi:hypothetical protein HPB49_011555 [Dermacentor silvarum]|uniref:Uncharacterized protein n=1 Tax=Dermacentor silvarum TaxID=543639 RepID=A0ACB8D551_DERSI|nr:hypothetical protein HPB49_011555 [Dermacentor silvarum]